MDTTVRRIAGELGLKEGQVDAAVRLLNEGAAVPFIARYRKDATGGLETAHLRAIEHRLRQLREFDERRAVIVRNIDEQGKLTPELRAALIAADSKARLEDLYLPYRPKKRSRAHAAREAGLEPLARRLVQDPTLSPEEEAERFVSVERGVPDHAAALDGARWILMEELSEHAGLLDTLRRYVWDHARIHSRVLDGRQEKGAKFSDLFDASDAIKAVPCHRALAMFRGRREGVLRLSLAIAGDSARSAPAPGATGHGAVPAASTGSERPSPPAEAPGTPDTLEDHPTSAALPAEAPAEPPADALPAPPGVAQSRAEAAAPVTAPPAPGPAEPPPIPGELPREVPPFVEEQLAQAAGVADLGRPADAWLRETVRRAWKMKVFPHLQVDLETRAREHAEQQAIRVLGRTLRDLLLAPPAGARPTMGLDPGLRTGVKVAVVDAEGTLLETALIFPHPPKSDWDASIESIAALIARHGVEMVAVGNGTGSRETDRLLGEVRKRYPQPAFSKVIVPEAGASAYSTSKLAARELGGVEPPIRAAVSIARRLQDPLAELVKIEPRAMALGQHQHDVNQAYLARALDEVIEDAVNLVGADVNLATTPVLRRICGFNQRLAETIVAYRASVGPFTERHQLRLVPGLGDRAFEQAAGFLRVAGGASPIDETRIHPEAYEVVERIAAATGRSIGELIGDRDAVSGLTPERFADGRVGALTVRDILTEIAWPFYDPRPEFRMAAFRDGVSEIEDLQPGMVLEGVVTNVADFGAFVDIGVHQDGLVHVSRMAGRFVRDPREVVKTGTVVRVRVVEVDLKRRRIALSMRFGEGRAEGVRPARQKSPRPPAAQQPPRSGRPAGAKAAPPDRPAKPPAVETAMSVAFSRLLKRPDAGR